jgi:hypothetical protein
MASAPPQVVFGSSDAKPDRDGTKGLARQHPRDRRLLRQHRRVRRPRRHEQQHAPHPREVDEFDAAGVPKAPCESIACARVANAPAALECRLSRIVRLAGESNFAVFGIVTGVHLRDDCLVDGRST